MHLLLYIFGPLLALGLPIFLLVVSGILGATAERRSEMLATPAKLVIFAALTVPTGAKFSSTTQWPAPWLMAAYFGEFEFPVVGLLLLASAAVTVFFLAAFVRSFFRTRSAPVRHAPMNRRHPPPP